MFTGSDSSFISVYVFMTVVWVELQHRQPGITAAIVFRGTTFRSSSHWLVGVVVQTDTPTAHKISDDSDGGTQTAYPAPSWPCARRQHLHWS